MTPICKRRNSAVSLMQHLDTHEAERMSRIVDRVDISNLDVARRSTSRFVRTRADRENGECRAVRAASDISPWAGGTIGSLNGDRKIGIRNVAHKGNSELAADDRGLGQDQATYVRIPVER